MARAGKDNNINICTYRVVRNLSFGGVAFLGTARRRWLVTVVEPPPLLAFLHSLAASALLASRCLLAAMGER